MVIILKPPTCSDSYRMMASCGCADVDGTCVRHLVVHTVGCIHPNRDGNGKSEAVRRGRAARISDLVT